MLHFSQPDQDPPQKLSKKEVKDLVNSFEKGTEDEKRYCMFYHRKKFDICSRFCALTKFVVYFQSSEYCR